MQENAHILGVRSRGDVPADTPVSSHGVRAPKASSDLNSFADSEASSTPLADCSLALSLLTRLPGWDIFKGWSG